jgi:hypothetical protein
MCNFRVAQIYFEDSRAYAKTIPGSKEKGTTHHFDCLSFVAEGGIASGDPWGGRLQSFRLARIGFLSHRTCVNFGLQLKMGQYAQGQ